MEHIRIRIIITSVLIFASILTGYGKDDRTAELSAGRWAALDNKQLLEKGNEFIKSGGSIDSALIYYSVLANRYWTGKHDKESMRCYAKAFLDLQICYTLYIYDYDRASQNIVRAKQIAEDEGFADLLPNINMGEANLYTVSSLVDGSLQTVDHAIKGYCNAFDAANKVHDYQTMVLSIMNMASVANSYHQWDKAGKYVDLFLSMNIPSVPYSKFTRSYCLVLKDIYGKNYAAAQKTIDAMPSEIDAKEVDDRCLLLVSSAQIDLYSAQGEFRKAMAEAIKVESAAKSNNAYDILVNTYHVMANIADSLDDHNLAENYRNKELQCRDYLYSQAHIEQVKNIPLLTRLSEMNREAQESAERQARMQKALLAGGILLLIALIAVAILYRRYRKQRQRNIELYEQNVELLRHEAETEQKEQQEPSRNITPTEGEDLTVRIRYVLRSREEVYKPNFSIRTLAELVGAKYWEVSQAINDHFHQNFAHLIAEYRIKEACRRINDIEHYGNLTLEAIAEGVGFRSRANFGKLFKESTGLTPSAYKKIADKELSKKTD